MTKYKERLDKLNYSDTENSLKNFHDELIAITRGRIRIFAEETN